MPNAEFHEMQALIAALDPARHVLLAGPTASGKSELALEIARCQGGTIVNADASQVYACWRVLTARPSLQEERATPHALYGHVAADAPYSAGHWLRDIAALLASDRRLIITGGTGLYFSALTKGLAEVPETPPDVRERADRLPLDVLVAQLDTATASRIDLANRARVQRAWEVLTATGKSLSAWQAQTPAPLLAEAMVHPVLVDAPKKWLNARIEKRFDRMLEVGALEEVAAVLPHYDPNLPAHRAIGVPELVAYLRGGMDLEEARSRATIATRQFAKRQRTWFRSKMADWMRYFPPQGCE